MFRERLLLAMAHGHALASRTSVSLSDLSDQQHLDRLHCDFRTRVTTNLGERAIIRIQRLRSEREDLIRQAVAEGVCKAARQQPPHTIAKASKLEPSSTRLAAISVRNASETKS
jgi:hypothetical protein